MGPFFAVLHRCSLVMYNRIKTVFHYMHSGYFLVNYIHTLDNSTEQEKYKDYGAVFSSGSDTFTRLIFSVNPIFDQNKKNICAVLAFRHQTSNNDSYETKIVFNCEYKYSAETVFNTRRQLWLMLRHGTG